MHGVTRVGRCTSHSQQVGRSVVLGAALLSFVHSAGLTAQSIATWRLTPEVRIGQKGTNGEYEFTRILKVLPAPDGSVVIADAGSKDISIFTRNGAYSRSIGRVGRGPGEFELLQAVGFLGDTLWVIGGGRQISLFSLDGQLYASTRMSSSGHLTALLPGGAGIGLASTGGFSGVTEHLHKPMPVILMTRAAQTVDTIGWLPMQNTVVALPRPDGSFTIGRQRFSDAGIMFIAPNVPLLFIVDRSVTTRPQGAEFRVTALQANGDTLWHRTISYTPRKVERERADSLMAAWQRAAPGVNRTEIRRAVFLPEYYAPVTDAFAGHDGSIWLRREEGQATVEYWVIGRDGRLTATLSVPANVTLMAMASSEVWGVEMDQYDVPTVIRYAITR